MLVLLKVHNSVLLGRREMQSIFAGMFCLVGNCIEMKRGSQDAGDWLFTTFRAALTQSEIDSLSGQPSLFSTEKCWLQRRFVAQRRGRGGPSPALAATQWRGARRGLPQEAGGPTPHSQLRTRLWWKNTRLFLLEASAGQSYLWHRDVGRSRLRHASAFL